MRAVWWQLMKSATFIRCGITPANLSNINLHSTMLLLYLYHPWGVLPPRAGIYIPLCFYFIDIGEWPSCNISLIYIPLCFYFIEDGSIGKMQYYVFTFHYASTLSGIRTVVLFVGSSIYIPLCFYFIPRGSRHLCLTMKYLHSTMLLLYRWRLLVVISPCPIYIPLCFYFIRNFRKSAELSLYLHSTMLLLYLCFLTFRIAVWSYLHSTMLLLYLHCICMIIDQHIIYIPLCFYFITKLLVGNSASLTLFTFHYASTLSNVLCTSIALISAFTFHYASTLSKTQALEAPASAPFTFHYASTLSYLLFCRSHCLGFIYIPLCFYFIDELNRFRTLLNLIYIPLCFYFIYKAFRNGGIFFYLHSTMLLLYRRREQSMEWTITIYIPLCFYFISRSAFICFSIASIYIPLCFYFIAMIQMGAFWLLAIYIPLCFYFIWYRGMVRQKAMTYLHSTMLLLYPVTVSSGSDLFLIYIPLCFYFISAKLQFMSTVSLFTFHYASTLSCIIGQIRCCIQYLHSTMLLLYRHSPDPWGSLGPIYIPLCFYFIH